MPKFRATTARRTKQGRGRRVGYRKPDSLGDLCREVGPVVYFIRTKDDLIKVGHTGDLQSRKRHFGSGWEHILAIVPGTLADEQDLHARFAEHRARGEEYYAAAAPLIDHINDIRRRLNVPPIEAWTPGG